MPPQPVNPHSTPEARRLYEFLHAIGGRYTLSGQHNFISSGNRYTELARRITGKIPLVWGNDFSYAAIGEKAAEHRACGPLNLSDPADPFEMHPVTPEQARSGLVRTVIKRHHEGHIITLMWHCGFPADGDSVSPDSIWTFENRPTQETWEELTTQGTPLQRQWKEQASRVADCLDQLKRENIPVLWRPYHEMNGVWFWWCYKSGENGFRRLWIMMYDYFVKERGLDHLLWVWNTNAPRDRPGDEAYAYSHYYPGDEYVDVLAADVYRSDYRQSHHDDLAELAGEKPIALGEVGEIPTPAILDEQPRWAWFMPWGHLIERVCTEDEVRALYDSPRVLSLEDVRRTQDSGYEVAR